VLIFSDPLGMIRVAGMGVAVVAPMPLAMRLSVGALTPNSSWELLSFKEANSVVSSARGASLSVASRSHE
jgi:hypothetical protein